MVYFNLKGTLYLKNIFRSFLAIFLLVLLETQTLVFAMGNSNSYRPRNISYDFYDNKCISTVKYDGLSEIWYFYDSKNQLIREDDKIQDRTVLYSYDDNGNILSKKIYRFSNGGLIEQLPEISLDYNYNSLGEMISYNGLDVSYDEAGNTLKYYNGWNFEWENDKLKKASNSESNIEYFYDENGKRTKKVVNGEAVYFNFNDLDDLNQTSNDGVFKWYVPKDITSPSFSYKGLEYQYVFNALGDIVGIKNDKGVLVASYVYDSWGKLISLTDENGNDVTNDKTHIGYINPLRYRGYYYDSETKLYYLNYRSYDPEVGRFLSKDNIVNDDYNLYVYCRNNPINMVDYDGHEPITLSMLMGLGVAEVVLLATAVYAIMTPMLLRNPQIGKTVNAAIDWAVKSFIEVGSTIAAKFKNLGQNLCNAIANLAKGYNIYLAKQMIPASMKKPGGNMSTPNMDPDDWEKLKNGQGYKHKKSGWTAKKGPPHGGEHWDVSPPNGKGHADIALDGKVIRGFRH